MFWGATIEGGKKYGQIVKQAFQVTTAALKVSPSEQDGAKYSVYVNYNGREFLMCTLAPSSGIFQVPLGVQFEAGAKVEFRVEGGLKTSRVSLTGFVLSPHGVPATPSTLANSIPSGVQQSILKDKKTNAKQAQLKRVSIRDDHEEKTFEKDSDEDGLDLENSDDDDDDNDDAEEDGLEMEDSDEDEAELFNLEDSDDDDENDDDDDDLSDLDLDAAEMGDEEEPAISVLSNGSSEGKGKKKKGAKLNFSGLEDTPPATSKAPSASPPSKKQKMDTSKTRTPETMKTPEMKAAFKAPSSAGHTPMKTLHKSGVMITEVKIGNGQQAKAGKKVKVNYVGRLKKNDRVFDRGDIGFHLAKNEVIKGWDIGIEGMKVGGKRKLVIPPHLAYGKTGCPPDIPPNSALIFDVELKQA